MKSSELCKISGCSLFRRNHRTNYCPIHNCHSRGCNFPRAGDIYCDGHRCIFPTCSTFTDIRNTACVKHKCHYSLCYNQIKNEDSKLCNDHICEYEDCDEHKYGYSDICYKIKYLKYCLQHMCKRNWCRQVVLPDKKYCKIHLCQNENCADISLPNKKYCKIHLCQNNNCKKCSLPDKKYCSIQHNCNILDCENPTYYQYIV
mgnify:CR=1 FL=1